MAQGAQALESDMSMEGQLSQAVFAWQGAQSLKSDVSLSTATGEAPMRGVIRGLVASSGSGCEAVLMSHSTSGQPPCWTTRYTLSQELRLAERDCLQDLQGCLMRQGGPHSVQESLLHQSQEPGY